MFRSRCRWRCSCPAWKCPPRSSTDVWNVGRARFPISIQILTRLRPRLLLDPKEQVFTHPQRRQSASIGSALPPQQQLIIISVLGRSLVTPFMRGVVVGSKAFSNVTRNFSKLNPMNKLKTNSSSTLKSEGNPLLMEQNHDSLYVIHLQRIYNCNSFARSFSVRCQRNGSRPKSLGFSYLVRRFGSFKVCYFHFCPQYETLFFICKKNSLNIPVLDCI